MFKWRYSDLVQIYWHHVDAQFAFTNFLNQTLQIISEFLPISWNSMKPHTISTWDSLGSKMETPGGIKCRPIPTVRTNFSHFLTSIVGSYSSTKWFWMSWMVSALFPTPPAPTTTSLYSVMPEKETNTTTRSSDFPSESQPVHSFNQLILSSSSSHWHSEDSDLDLRRDLKVWSCWPLLERISSDNGEELKCLNGLTFARQESPKRSFNVQTDQWD